MTRDDIRLLFGICTISDNRVLRNDQEILTCIKMCLVMRQDLDSTVKKVRSSLIDIYVRDKYNGMIHRIGDDPHDMLTIEEDGHLHYQHLQNGDGCVTGENYRDAGYEFVPNMDDHGFNYDPREKEDDQS